MAEVIHEHRPVVHDESSGAGAWIVGAVLAVLALLLAWWLFLSASSPLAPERDTTIIQQEAPPAQPDVNVVPPDVEGDTDINVVPPSGETSTQ